MKHRFRACVSKVAKEVCGPDYAVPTECLRIGQRYDAHPPHPLFSDTRMPRSFRFLGTLALAIVAVGCSADSTGPATSNLSLANAAAGGGGGGSGSSSGIIVVTDNLSSKPATPEDARRAVAEFLAYPSTPRPVIINEALEIARKFSSPESVQFVNGVLDSVGKELEKTG